jgi:adenosylmethionine-8-amino-7-oxononanoate aminotransferase
MQTKHWIQKDLKLNWHPFMQMKDFEDYPPKRIISARGLKLFAEDTWYYDTISSWWCNILGHCHPDIVAALSDQVKTLDHIMFGNFTHDGAVMLSERLTNQTPIGLDRVYYSDNGSTAIEVALKMSLNYWMNTNQPNKTGVVSFCGAYHGDTVGAMSISGVSQYNGVFKPLMFPSIGLPDPSVNEDLAVDALSDMLALKSSAIAAVVVEPILMGAGGMKLTSPDFFRRVRQLTSKFNVHLISDEVATGFGRTGHWFASNMAGVSPDFMCLSKALTNGQLPLAVTITTNHIYSAFYADFEASKTFYHGHTFTANPLGCAVANATLNYLENNAWQPHVAQINNQLTKGFLELSKRFSFASSPRTIGTVGAIDLQLPGDRPMFKLSQLAFKYNLSIRPLGNTIYLFLPLITTLNQVNDIMNRLFDCLDHCNRQVKSSYFKMQ